MIQRNNSNKKPYQLTKGRDLLTCLSEIESMEMIKDGKGFDSLCVGFKRGTITIYNLTTLRSIYTIFVHNNIKVSQVVSFEKNELYEGSDERGFLTVGNGGIIHVFGWTDIPKILPTSS